MTPRELLRRTAIALLLPVLVLGGPFFAHAAAPPGRYDLQVDSVTDTVTKLKWQRTVMPGVDFVAATSFCASAAFGGLANGWRVPTAREAVTLLDIRALGSTRALDVAFFGGDFNTVLWTSTFTAGGRIIVALDTSNQLIVRTMPEATPGAVLCVHE